MEVHLAVRVLLASISLHQERPRVLNALKIPNAQAQDLCVWRDSRRTDHLVFLVRVDSIRLLMEMKSVPPALRERRASKLIIPAMQGMNLLEPSAHLANLDS